MADYIFYPAIALTGGTDEALDGYDGADLNDGDVGIVVNITGIRIYHLDDDSGAVESSPDVISPADNPGTKRWILQDIVDNHTHDSRYFTETEITTWRNSVTQTEMGYVNGVTSDIQTQINALIGAAGVTYENLSANGDIGTGATQVSQGDHAHGDIYYTETELDAGQLDNRYFTESEHLNASAGAGDAGKPVKLDAGGKIDTTMIERSDLEDTFYTETEEDAWRNGVTQTEMGYLDGVTSDIQTQIGTKIGSVVEDITPQLGGDLDMNGKGIDFPSTPNITDVKDEDNMVSDSATMLATQQSIKKYVDDNAGGINNVVEDITPQLGGDLDMNGKGIDFPSTANITDCKDEDNMVSDSATMLATQQSIKKYVDDHVVKYVKVSDVKATTTDGGTFTQAAWQTRVLNTEDSDPDGICSLASNQITLAAGTYECRIVAPAYYVLGHQARLRNVTGGTTILVGTSHFSSTADTNVNNYAMIMGRFTIAASQALEVQHYCGTTKTATGFGIASDTGLDEIYTVAEFWKVP